MKGYLKRVKNRYAEAKMLSIGIGWHWTDWVFIITGEVIK